MDIISKYSLKDKVAVISGGTGFIGKAIVNELSLFGAKIVILYNKNYDTAVQLMERINSSGGQCDILKVDITNNVEIDSARQAILKMHKQIDVLVVSSGIKNRGAALLTKQVTLEDLLAINIKGAIELSKIFLKSMVARNRGRVLLIGSHAGIYGMPGQAVYAATKSALSAWASSLAAEVGGNGITVNVIAPGALHDPNDNLYSESEQAEICNRIGAKRLGYAEEVANLVTFLSTDAAAYINGTTISVDGGARF